MKAKLSEDDFVLDDLIDTESTEDNTQSNNTDTNEECTDETCKEENNTTFYEWWMSKLGIKNYNRQKLKIFMRYYVPLILVCLGIITQEIFKIKVLGG